MCFISTLKVSFDLCIFSLIELFLAYFSIYSAESVKIHYLTVHNSSSLKQLTHR